MKIPLKRTAIVAAFLAGLCSCMAAVIAGVDLATRQTIAQNRIDKENKGLAKIFGPGEFGEAIVLEESEFPLLKKYWTVEGIGRIYSASGKNSYGDVSLLVGVYEDYSLGNIAVLENTESYGATLEEGYLEPYADAEDKEKAVEDVSCGATYGAKLCREMIRQSQAHYKGGSK